MIQHIFQSWNGKHDDHWWWDNLNHFVSGFLIAMIAPDHERGTALTLAVVWELIEARLASMDIDVRFDVVPEPFPKAVGYDGWGWDHQMEDTLLDVLMVYYGARLARSIKKRM